MKNPQSEKLSALLDGELSYTESTQLLDELLADHDSKALLNRYQLMRSCLNGERARINHADLFTSIHQRLSEEPVVLAPTATAGRIPHAIKRLASGGALAAGVAAAVIFAVNTVSLQLQGPSLVSDSSVPANKLAPINALVPSRASQQDVEFYLEEHESLVSQGSLGTGLPLATMVGYNGN